MMMPANYSAIAENELTYVVGGGLVDILAPAMTTENWQNVNYNTIQLIGNAYLGKLSQSAFDTVFGGAYVPGKVAENYFGTLTNIWSDNNKGDWAFAKALLNTGLQVVGTLASIYTLGSDKIGITSDSLDNAALRF